MQPLRSKKKPTRRRSLLLRYGAKFRRLPLLASLAIPILPSGCAEKTVTIVDLRPWKPISFSCEDTSETRKQAVAHNSVYDTLKRKKKVVYSDPCPESKPTS